MDKLLDWTYDTGNYSGLPELVEDLHTHGQHYVIIVVSKTHHNDDLFDISARVDLGWISRKVLKYGISLVLRYVLCSYLSLVYLQHTSL